MGGTATEGDVGGADMAGGGGVRVGDAAEKKGERRLTDRTRLSATARERRKAAALLAWAGRRWAVQNDGPVRGKTKPRGHRKRMARGRMMLGHEKEKRNRPREKNRPARPREKRRMEFSFSKHLSIFLSLFKPNFKT